MLSSMAATRSLGSTLRCLLSLFFLLVGCFIFARCNGKKERKKKKSRAVSSYHSGGLSCSWLYLKKVFLSSTKLSKKSNAPITTLTSARSSQNSLVTLIQPENILPDPEAQNENGQSCSESDISSDSLFSPLRNDIFPCTTCGEIFTKSQHLELHRAIQHAVSALIDGESSTNILNIIFKSGWPDKAEKNPQIYRILKINNNPKILARFEEYREFVKTKAVRNVGGATRRCGWDERCAADGNELLRFYCSTFMCNLGQNGNSSLCGQQYCSICGIIKSGFSPKMDGIATMATSWRAHVALPEDVEEEFRFMNVKRAMLICRVVAGRFGCDAVEEKDVDKESGGYDSMVIPGRRNASGPLTRTDDEEILVLNPRAVLPCFVIVYTA